MRSFARDRASLAFVVAACLMSGTALAEPSAEDKATARSMLVDGYRELEGGDPKRALELFRGADALMHVPTTRLAVARAHAKLGKLVEAEDVLRELLRTPERSDDPPPYVKARADARALVDELARRVPQLTVADVAADAVVKIDGVVVARESLIGARKMDPGRHVVTVTSPAGPAREVKVELREGARQTVSMGFAEGAATTATPPDEPPPTPGGGNVLAYAGFGVGAVGIATGAVTGLLAISKKNDTTDRYCDGGSTCPPAADHGLSIARTYATVSTIGFIAGAVGIAAGIFAVATGTGRTSAAALRPTVAIGGAGVEGSF